jgi:hypothetical protein
MNLLSLIKFQYQVVASSVVHQRKLTTKASAMEVAKSNSLLISTLWESFNHSSNFWV